MKQFLSRRFCRILFLFVLVLLFCAGLSGDVHADQTQTDMAFCIVTGGDDASGNPGTLFMKIHDINGVKRLLSPRHPAVLTQGLYFTFPSDTYEYEMSHHGGPWIKTATWVYLEPRRTAGVMMDVQFRARGSDGELRYSRKYVLIY